MASADLNGCRARLERTEEQINDLTDAIVNWVQTNPCMFTVDDKSKPGARYYFFEPLYRRSLAIREKALGPDHPDDAQSLGVLRVAVVAPWA